MASPRHTGVDGKRRRSFRVREKQTAFGQTNEELDD
jgi:hypothetical protein